ncbi:efflux RND transporter periplasmic adaptor subunit [Methylobacterium sp. J-076]|uniref:efflux RND transporter periplasmic adaptor subunit n=1 Tax=Methylobacterium sp. J-076 TaxID=2836655 RepID=UPI001FBA3986|nr:efflux RND transporter periplasmic adaptor subunit [Methylobacterium sp. J-076]MCJ2013626.1 efflux RND transporter periplasmic adaptor subunit [Methylobacterium sp. J-076]
MRTAVKVGVGAGLIVLAGAGGWYAAGRPSLEHIAAALPFLGEKPAKDLDEPPLQVRVVTVRTVKVPIAFTYTGTIISQQDATLQARVTGNVTERPFEPGGHVKKGQVLFRIDPRPFEVALQTAKSQQAQAEAQLTFAQAEVDRTESLADKGYATEQRFQQLQANRTSAVAQVQGAEAAIARQNLNLDYAVVNAPFDGRASLSTINPGDLVIENQTHLVSVVQLDPIDIQMALSSEDSEAVRTAMKTGGVTVSVLGEDGTPVREAKIYQLDNRFDPRTARRLVRALMPNDDERFLPGQFVRASIRTGTQEKLLVPTAALDSQLAQQIVYAVDATGKVRQKPVTTGDTYGDNTAILDGLSAGDQVVVDHLQEMRENLKVTTQPAGDVKVDGKTGADAPASGGPG